MAAVSLRANMRETVYSSEIRAITYLTQQPFRPILEGMERKADFPQTLIEAIRHFSDLDIALAALVALRWPNGVRCPHCESDKVTVFASRLIWQCKDCRRQFSAKVWTI